MKRTFPRLLAVLATALLGTAACTDTPTESRGPAGGQAALGFSLNLSGTSVAELGVEVTASDIPTPLVFNIPVAANGTASGVIHIPAGAARTITVTAYDSAGHLTHRGSRTVEVLAEDNPALSITLQPIAAELPLLVNFGSVVVSITRVDEWLPEFGDAPGDTARYTAAVTQPDGTPIEGARVRWASLNPAVASVDSTGLVTARKPGTTQLVATWAGYAASVVYLVQGDGTNGTVDHTPPTITAFTLSKDTVDVSEGPDSITFTATARDVGAGVDSLWVALLAPTGPGFRSCRNTRSVVRGGPDAVTVSCTIRFPQWGQNGEWTLDGFIVADSLGNSDGYVWERLIGSGYERTFTVVGAQQDTVPPSLWSLAFSADTADTLGMYKLHINVWDEHSGVTRIRAMVGEPGEGGMRSGCSIDHTLESGEYECPFFVDGPVASGEITLLQLEIQDHGGNKVVFTPEQLEGWGMLPRMIVPPTVAGVRAGP